MKHHAEQRRWLRRLLSCGLHAAQHAAWAAWRGFWRLVRGHAFVAARAAKASAEFMYLCAAALRQLRLHAAWRWRWRCAAHRSDERRAARALYLWCRRATLSCLGGRGVAAAASWQASRLCYLVITPGRGELAGELLSVL